jgi:hypothetical protein
VDEDKNRAETKLPERKGRTMTHYGIVQWVDFARGVAPEDDTLRMREHLAAGCPDCRQVVAFCERVAGVCQAMAAQPVPESAVCCARAIFTVRQPAPRRRAFRIPVELLYDSFLAPEPAGLRSSWQVGWQALYRTGDCCVDLRIEPDLRSSRAAIIGQISNRLLPETGMTGLAVCLKSGKDVIAETLSNRFGEFQLEYDQKPRLQLCIYLDGGSKAILLPLKRVAGENATANAGRRAAGKNRKGGDPQ